MVDLILATKILGVFYKKWFENYVIGIFPRDIETCVEGDKNEILKAVQFLQDQYLIELGEWSYRITATGIQRYEDLLSPSVVNERVTQRKKILEMLKKVYDNDVNQYVEDKEVYTNLGRIDKNELLGQVEYMQSMGLIELTLAMGGSFAAKLTGSGASTFERQETHNYQIMSNAYRMLFLLENNLRIFLQEKLYEKYGTQWWEKGISQGLRDKADERKNEENSLGFKISETKNDIEYLSFPDLSKIIVNQWKEVFESIFKDQSTVELKLKELEAIRNAIAHNRTLSNTSMTRLEQYESDILNLIKK
jgi:hypothetical protein